MMGNQHDRPSEKKGMLTVGQQKAQAPKETQGKQRAYLFEPSASLTASWLGFLLLHSGDISRYANQFARFLAGGDG